jgi:prepilin-type N-terminal cleavage/methylation domain-containing protein
MDPRRAFTLIELLVVLSIMGILAGAGFSMLGIAQRSAKQTNTKVLLAKIDAGLRQFRQDSSVLPYRAWGVTDPATAWGNDLARRLAHRLTADERSTMLAAVEQAAGRYLPPGNASATSQAYYWYDGSAVRRYTPDRANQKSGLSDGHVIALNRMATERARLQILAGVAAAKAPAWDAGAGRWTETSGTALLSSTAPPGWCDDYLGDSLQRSDRSDADPLVIIDRFGSPLSYVCPVRPGVRGFVAKAGECRIDEVFYGLNQSGRNPTSKRDSDVRDSAGSAFCGVFELWSAGSDRLLDAQRTASVNRDNIAAGDYLRGLE